jgi:regulatory protein
VSKSGEDPLLGHALKLLAGRDYSTHQIRKKLEKRSGSAAGAIDNVIGHLLSAHYLDDDRYARNFVESRLKRGRPQLQVDLERAGVGPKLARRVLDDQDWPSIAQALQAKMKSLNLGRPLKLPDAGRLSRALQRLGYDAEEVESELDKLL